jgi:hypothetical protein
VRVSGSVRGRVLKVAPFSLVTAGIEASIALYFSSLGVSDPTLLVLVSAGVIGVLACGWAEVREWAPVSREVRTERRLSRKERRQPRKEVGGRSLLGPDLRATVLVLVVFLVALGSPFLLMSAPVLAGLRGFYGGLPDQLRGVTKGAWEFLRPLYNLDLVYKYALSQNFAALCSAIVVVLLGRWRRR